MRGNDSKRRRGLAPLRLTAFWALAALFAALSAGPAEAWTYAYVTNWGGFPNPGTVSVIDTASNKVVATIAVGSAPRGIAVAPDRKHAYVTNQGPGTVSVIDTLTNLVVATIPVGQGPVSVALTPDGTRAYVANSATSDVSVIDTVRNSVIDTIRMAASFDPSAVVVAPDGKHAYVTTIGPTEGFGIVSVIDTASNTVAATVPVGLFPCAIAVTPDATHVYVTNEIYGDVSVIETAGNRLESTISVGPNPCGVAVSPNGRRVYITHTYAGIGAVSVIETDGNGVVATVQVGRYPAGVSVTPDGKHIYVVNDEAGPSTVSVIDAASNKVVATVPVGIGALGVGIVPPPPKIFFSAFSAASRVDLAQGPNQSSLSVVSAFTLGQASNGINPAAEPVTLKVGDFAATIPPGSFEGQGFGPFTFDGTINGKALSVLIEPTGTKRYALNATLQGVNSTGLKAPAALTLTIGDDTGAATVKANIAQTTPLAPRGSTSTSPLPPHP